MKFKVPMRVSVAPVQTYERTVTVEADSKADAAEKVREQLTDLIHTPGWKAVGGRMESVVPDQTTYETYLDERGLDEWAGQEPTNDH